MYMYVCVYILYYVMLCYYFFFTCPIYLFFIAITSRFNYILTTELGFPFQKSGHLTHTGMKTGKPKRQIPDAWDTPKVFTNEKGSLTDPLTSTVLNQSETLRERERQGGRVGERERGSKDRGRGRRTDKSSCQSGWVLNFSKRAVV